MKPFIKADTYNYKSFHIEQHYKAFRGQEWSICFDVTMNPYDIRTPPAFADGKCQWDPIPPFQLSTRLQHTRTVWGGRLRFTVVDKWGVISYLLILSETIVAVM